MRLKRENISTFAIMKQFLLFIFLSLPCCLLAQNERAAHVKPEDRKVDMDNPTFVPMVKVSKVDYEGDSIQYVELNKIYVFPQAQFSSARQRQAYNRLVYNVKKVLPIAKEVNHITHETR